MAISISIEINRSFELAADFDSVFDTLADVPKSASYFPKVDQLVSLGDNVYRWEMQKIGVDRHALQTIYTCRYKVEKKQGSIIWEPVEGEGNGHVSGSWSVKPEGGRLHLNFITKGQLELPLPSLLKLAISPVVKHEFNALVDTYIKNLKAAFAG